MQCREAVELDFDEIGNLAVFGASGTGKTGFLLTLAASTSEAAAADPVHWYLIDAVGGGLDVVRVLPTVAAVARLEDEELVERVLRRVQSIVAERGKRFASARAEDLRSFRVATGEREPRVVLGIDGYSVFRQWAEGESANRALVQMLTEVMQAGRAVGVHVVLTADRPAALPAVLAATVQAQLVLRLAAPGDYLQVGVSSEVLYEAQAGRAVLAGQPHEVQLAMLAEKPTLAAHALALEQLTARLPEHSLVPVEPVRNAPSRVSLRQLPAEVDGLPSYALEVQHLRPLGLPASGLALISGPAGSGVSTAARACVTAMHRWAEARGELVESTLLSPVEELLAGTERMGECAWGEVVRGESAVAERAERLCALLRASRSAPVRSPHQVIVVERAHEAEGTPALAALVALAKLARSARALVLFEYENGVTSTVWELHSVLKQAQWGLALHPSEHDGGSPFRVVFERTRRTEPPPGRGYAVLGGKAVPVQIADPEGHWG